MKRFEESLIENLHAFVAFARSRVGDPHLAEDMVQASLAKALASAKKPANEEETVIWFYRNLRHSNRTNRCSPTSPDDPGLAFRLV